MKKTVPAQLHARLDPIRSDITAAIRTNLSYVHLASAAQFSSAVGKIELENAKASWGTFFEEIIANASACVLLSVASLEAFANELFIDHDRFFPAVREELISRLWTDCERAQVLGQDRHRAAARGSAGAEPRRLTSAGR